MTYLSRVRMVRCTICGRGVNAEKTFTLHTEDQGGCQVQTYVCTDCVESDEALSEMLKDLRERELT